MKLEYGWTGRLLWVDLKEQTSHVEDISNLCEDYIGCRGIAIQYAWKHLKPGTGAFSEDNLLMFFTGPVAGTPVLGGGRAYFFGVGAQSYPEMYTRSSIGGRCGESLKQCNFDGIIFANKSKEPVIVEITEEGAVFHDGKRYWGRFAVDTQREMKQKFGDHVESCVIGPAGENKVRLAGIFNDLDNTAAQAGFGAVMGDKNMKAFVLNGHSAVKVADLSTIIRLRDENMRLKTIPKAPVEPLLYAGYKNANLSNYDFKGSNNLPIEKHQDQLGELTYITQKGNTCVACGVPCHLTTYEYIRGAKGRWHKNMDTTHSMKCVAPLLYGWPAKCEKELEWLQEELGRVYRWPMDFRRGSELGWYLNNMGLNSWDLVALFQWLTELEAHGVNMDELTGIHWDVDDPALMPHLCEMMCYREGFGNIMAEGSVRAAEMIGGQGLKSSDHALHGMNAHSLGTCSWYNLKFPYWIAPALMWAVGTRDPMSDEGHKYCDFGGRRIPFKRLPELAKGYYYGAEHTIDPDPDLFGKIPDEEFFNLGYTDKEYAVKKQEIRGVIMGCGVFCDTLYPQTLAPGEPENGYHGDWEMESKLLTAVTGVKYDEARLEEISTKIWNMERAYSILDIERTRDYDMYITHCHDARGGDWTMGFKIDPHRFGKLLDRYYALVGWDEDGIPTEETLLKYDLVDINERIKEYREKCVIRRKTTPKYEDVPANIAPRGSEEFMAGRKYSSSVNCARFLIKD